MSFNIPKIPGFLALVLLVPFLLGLAASSSSSVRGGRPGSAELCESVASSTAPAIRGSQEQEAKISDIFTDPLFFCSFHDIFTVTDGQDAAHASTRQQEPGLHDARSAEQSEEAAPGRLPLLADRGVGEERASRSSRLHHYGELTLISRDGRSPNAVRRLAAHLDVLRSHPLCAVSRVFLTEEEWARVWTRPFPLRIVLTGAESLWSDWVLRNLCKCVAAVFVGCMRARWTVPGCQALSSLPYPGWLLPRGNTGVRVLREQRGRGGAVEGARGVEDVATSESSRKVKRVSVSLRLPQGEDALASPGVFGEWLIPETEDANWVVDPAALEQATFRGWDDSDEESPENLLYRTRQDHHLHHDHATSSSGEEDLVLGSSPTTGLQGNFRERDLPLRERDLPHLFRERDLPRTKSASVTGDHGSCALHDEEVATTTTPPAGRRPSVPHAAVSPQLTTLADAATVVLYLHGGGFLLQSPQFLRPFTKRLALHTSAPVFVPRYRLVRPGHTSVMQALQDVWTAYIFLVRDCAVPASRIVLVGDSAGGTLVSALLLMIRDWRRHHRRLDHESDKVVQFPRAGVLISPWVNLRPDTTKESCRTGRDIINLNCIIDWGNIVLAGLEKEEHRLARLSGLTYAGRGGRYEGVLSVCQGSDLTARLELTRLDLT